MSRLAQHLAEGAELLSRVLADEALLAEVDRAGDILVSCLKAGGKILSAGNGGSHCDAMHFAEELSGRYRDNRPALGALANNGGPTETHLPLGGSPAIDSGDNALALDPLAVGAVFSVPPGRVDPLKEDVSTRWPLFSATDDSFRESGLSLMTPPGQDNPVNLGALRARGAKMVLFHGVSDAVFSAEDTRRWIERLDQAQDGKAADFARYFPVPGMNHCSGGPAADQFDLLTPLVQWVEQGVAPQAVPASVRGAGHAGGANAELPKDWSASRTRPLCAYPTVARYAGSGSLEDAASFSCR